MWTISRLVTYTRKAYNNLLEYPDTEQEMQEFMHGKSACPNMIEYHKEAIR